MSLARDNQDNDYIGLWACISLLLVGPLSSMAQSGLAPILPRISEHFAAVPNAEVLVRLMVSGLSFAMILGSLSAGFLSERLGQRRFLLILLGIYGLFGTAGAFVDNLYLLVGTRLIVGAAIAAAAVMTAAILTTRLPLEKRDRWLGFYIVVATFGGVAGIGLVGLVSKTDWRNAFLLHLAGFAVLLIVMMLLPPERKATPATKGEAAPRGDVPWALILFGLICGGTLTTSLVFLPFHLKLIGSGTPPQVALPVSISAFVGAVSAMTFGLIRARLSIVRTFMLGFALAGTGLATAALTSHYTMVLVGMTIFGWGVGYISPNLFAASAAAAPARFRARTMGFVRAGFYAGPLAGQLAMEPVSRFLGPAAAVMGVACVAFAAVALSTLVGRAFAPVEEPEAVAA
jgi:MFS family permease